MAEADRSAAAADRWQASEDRGHAGVDELTGVFRHARASSRSPTRSPGRDARTGIAAIQRSLDALPTSPSISARLAELAADDDLESVIARADSALYRAKADRDT